MAVVANGKLPAHDAACTLRGAACGPRQDRLGHFQIRLADMHARRIGRCGRQQRTAGTIGIVVTDLCVVDPQGAILVGAGVINLGSITNYHIARCARCDDSTYCKGKRTGGAGGVRASGWCSYATRDTQGATTSYIAQTGRQSILELDVRRCTDGYRKAQLVLHYLADGIVRFGIFDRLAERDRLRVDWRISPSE